ncbi:MAG: alanine racemase [Eubacteriales bacterium]|nr:alanine racemase [Eubacteriales bacterium]
MFLEKTLSRNEALIDAAVTLHQAYQIPANSYVLDVDAIVENVRMMAEMCHKYHMKLYPMTKQIGRNPVVIKALKEAGADGCVCVDMADARRVHEAGMKIGHLGHLVQVPAGETDAAVAMKPEYWTVYSMEKARAISEALVRSGLEKTYTQKVMARIYAEGDTYYTGHEGGFAAEDVVETARALDALPGLKFAGITSFPTQLFDADAVEVKHTHNYQTLLEAKERLEAAGFTKIEVNAPGTTSSHLFAEMAQKGITQVEPGHGMTGTTPLHALKDLAEKPAMVYVSEVCHFYKGRGYCYGGGMYIDPVFPAYPVKACVGASPEEARKNQVVCDIPSPAAIDYYGIFKPGASMKQGDTAVFGFRAQAFVTRAFVVPVVGISRGTPQAAGIFDSDGKAMGWPNW